MLPRSSRSGLECFKRISREPFPTSRYGIWVLPPRVGGALRRRQSLHNLGLTTSWRRADENRFSSAQLLNRVTSTNSKTFALNFGMCKFCSKLSGKFAAALPRALLPHTPGVSLKFPLVLGHELCSSPAPGWAMPPCGNPSSDDIQRRYPEPSHRPASRAAVEHHSGGYPQGD